MKMVQGWKHYWWRRFSTWLAAINGIFVGYVFSQPVLVVGLIGFAPTEWAMPLACGAGFLAFALPVLVAHIAQPKMQAKVQAKVQAKTKEQDDADEAG